MLSRLDFRGARLWLAIALAALVGLVVLRYINLRQPSAPAPGVVLLPWVGSQQPIAQAQPLERTPAADMSMSNTPSAALAQPVDEARSWTTGLVARDVYPAAIRLREARVKGSFAASRRLQMACLDALHAAGQPVGHYWLSAEPDPAFDLRLLAKQEVESRCGRLNSPEFNDLAKPLPGDAYGEKFMNAALTITDAVRDRKLMSDAMHEYIAQGQITDLVDRFAGRLSSWKGDSWADRKPDFRAAVRVALHRATSPPPGSGQRDLRDLTYCIRGGDCKGSRVELGATLTGDRSAAVEALAREMEQSLRANDITPWLPPTK
jgi:hypothetical protein